MSDFLGFVFKGEKIQNFYEKSSRAVRTCASEISEYRLVSNHHAGNLEWHSGDNHLSAIPNRLISLLL